jgi:hypothetical protein
MIQGRQRTVVGKESGDVVNQPKGTGVGGTVAMQSVCIQSNKQQWMQLGHSWLCLRVVKATATQGRRSEHLERLVDGVSAAPWWRCV